MARRQWLWGLIFIAVIALVILAVVLRPFERASPPVVLTATPTPAVAQARATPVAREAVSPVATPTTAVLTTTDLGILDVYVLDIGQGDSILLMGPDFTILIDTGRRERNDVVPYLVEIGVRSLDLLVGTHPDADHIGQFPQVLARFPVREVWMSGNETTTLTFERALDAIVTSGAAYREPRAGEVYEIGSARLEVLSPAELTGDTNDDSVVFRLLFGDVTFMFTGDAELHAEHEMVAAGYDLKSDILKLGHHGSSTSSSMEFLEAVDPEIAIWSAGRDNTYGHPHQITLDHLAELGVTVYGTAVDGTVVVETNGAHFAVVAYDPNPTAVAGCTLDQVNINTAPAEELETIIQIGPARARSILELRPFHSLDDMVRVPGITAAIVARIQEQGRACVE